MQTAVGKTKQKGEGSRYLELDSLRGIAVLAVVLYHYTFAYDFHFKLFSDHKFYLYHGNLAVPLFFVISGFVIFLTLEKSKKKADFAVSRFSRLYPSYWVAMFVTLIFISVLPVPTLGHYTPKEVVLNFTMFEGFTKARLIDQVYWTLKMELTFYIIMYLLYLNKLLSKIEYICVAWLLLSLASSMFKIPFKKYLDVLFILEYAPLFIAGINFYKIKNKAGSVFNHALIGLSFIFEVKWLLAHSDENYTSVLILAVIYGLFCLFAYGRLSWLNNRALLFLGAISYSLYLLHNVIGYTIIYRLRQHTDLQIFYVTLPFLLSVALATLMTFYIEKPAIRFIRTAYKKRNTKNAALKPESVIHEPQPLQTAE